MSNKLQRHFFAGGVREEKPQTQGDSGQDAHKVGASNYFIGDTNAVLGPGLSVGDSIHKEEDQESGQQTPGEEGGTGSATQSPYEETVPHQGQGRER